jgi:hypothetical protein
VKHIILPFLLLSLLVNVTASQAVLTNGDFATGLIGWSTLGDVTTDNQEAVLGDDGEVYSALWQAVALSPGSYIFEADILNNLSSALPDPFGFLDTVFATLFFTNDLSNFDPSANLFGDSELGVFDLDATGFFNSTATVGSSAKGVGWMHVTFGFQNTFTYVIPTFELFEQNFVNADSTVRIDNVNIQVSAVPEPGTLLLVGSGLWLLGRNLRRRTPSSVSKSAK